MTDSASFKRGMRRLASGVTLITTVDGVVKHGFIATAVTSVAADPVPTLLICVNASVSCHDVIARSGIFGVNLLSPADAPIVAKFSSSHVRHERFVEGDWRTLGSGVPTLTTAMVSFDCKVVSHLKVHTHTVFVAEVQEVAFGTEANEPLVYVDGRLAVLQPFISDA